MKLKSGHEVIELSEEENADQKNLFKGHPFGCIKLYPGDWFYPRPFINFADRIYDFKFRPSDTVIMTFPKCGTTWMQEIIWNMKYPSNLENPLEGVSVSTKCPFLEADFLTSSPNVPPVSPDSDLWQYFQNYCPGKNPQDGIFLQLAEYTPDPRIFKTHLTFPLLSPDLLNTCKVVFVVRNPKDVFISFYYHSILVKPHGYIGSIDKYFELFLKGHVTFGPYWRFLEEGWRKRNHPNFKLVRYEDLKKDPLREITILNEFLHTGLDKQTIEKIVEETSLQKMKERDLFAGNSNSKSSLVDTSKGSFFRSGTAGNWTEELSKEQNEVIDTWIKNNTENGNNFTLKYNA